MSPVKVNALSFFCVHKRTSWEQLFGSDFHTLVKKNPDQFKFVFTCVCFLVLSIFQLDRKSVV